VKGHACNPPPPLLAAAATLVQGFTTPAGRGGGYGGGGPGGGAGVCRDAPCPGAFSSVSSSLFAMSRRSLGSGPKGSSPVHPVAEPEAVDGWGGRPVPLAPLQQVPKWVHPVPPLDNQMGVAGPPLGNPMGVVRASP
jgi:hypothetical protein